MRQLNGERKNKKLVLVVTSWFGPLLCAVLHGMTVLLYYAGFVVLREKAIT